MSYLARVSLDGVVIWQTVGEDIKQLLLDLPIPEGISSESLHIEIIARDGIHASSTIVEPLNRL